MIHEFPRCPIEGHDNAHNTDGMDPNPFEHASCDALKTLVSMVLDWRDINRLAPLNEDLKDTPGIRMGCLYRQFALDAKESHTMGLALDAEFRRRLSPHAHEFKSSSLSELAHSWARSRETMGGLKIGALLWTLIRSRNSWYRPFERVVVEDVTVMAMRGLSRAGDEPAAPLWGAGSGMGP